MNARSAAPLKGRFGGPFLSRPRCLLSTHCRHKRGRYADGVDQGGNIGNVQPRHGTLRRTFLPIYGMDQLIFVTVVALPFVWLAFENAKLALFTGLGAYIGFVSTMQRSTPSSLVLPARDEPRVAAILDRSPFFERNGDGKWDSNKGRLKLWDTDNIRLERNGKTLRLTGRQIDLQKIAFLLEC